MAYFACEFDRFGLDRNEVRWPSTTRYSSFDHIHVESIGRLDDFHATVSHSEWGFGFTKGSMNVGDIFTVTGITAFN